MASFSQINDAISLIIPQLNLRDLAHFVSAEKINGVFERVRTDLSYVRDTETLAHRKLALVLSESRLSYLKAAFEDYFVPCLTHTHDHMSKRLVINEYTQYLSSLIPLPTCDTIVSCFTKTIKQLLLIQSAYIIDETLCTIIEKITVQDNELLMYTILVLITNTEEDHNRMINYSYHNICIHGALKCFGVIVEYANLITYYDCAIEKRNKNHGDVINGCPDEKLAQLIYKYNDHGFFCDGKIDHAYFMNILILYGRVKSIEAFVDCLKKNNIPSVIDPFNIFKTAMVLSQGEIADHIFRFADSIGKCIDINHNDNILMRNAICNDLKYNTSVYSEYLKHLASEGYGAYTSQIIQECTEYANKATGIYRPIN